MMQATTAGSSWTTYACSNEPALVSAREQQIIASLIVGATAREIANELRISVHTVRTHIRNIYSKTGVANRVELVLWTQRTDLSPEHAR
jgi:DNA-binding CsgD family transcriptional regulator